MKFKHTAIYDKQLKEYLCTRKTIHHTPKIANSRRCAASTRVILAEMQSLTIHNFTRILTKLTGFKLLH